MGPFLFRNALAHRRLLQLPAEDTRRHPWASSFRSSVPTVRTRAAISRIAACANAPGVVVIQEWWGLQDQIKGLCDRFAAAGFDALAPDLYRGTVVAYHDTDGANKAMTSLDFIDAHRTDGSRRRAISQAQRRQGRHHRLLHGRRGGDHRVARVPDVSAAVACLRHSAGGRGEAADVKIPLQVHFASKDDWCTPKVRAMSSRAKLKAAGKTLRIFPLRRRPCLRERAAHVGA